VENPWISVPDSAPYVLRCDEPYVTAFNESLEDDDVHRSIWRDFPYRCTDFTRHRWLS
jgi:hypothetical protein